MDGAERKATINLDFSGLFAEDSNGDSLPGGGENEQPEQAKRLLVESQREREDHRQSLAVYRAYQENIKQSEQLQTEIRKGIKTGEDIYSLFLKAVKAISLMTNNGGLFTQIEADIRDIYGKGLNYTQPLQIELQNAQDRLRRLMEAEQEETYTESREGIKKAVQAHREYITELEAKINRT